MLLRKAHQQLVVWFTDSALILLQTSTNYDNHTFDLYSRCTQIFLAYYPSLNIIGHVHILTVMSLCRSGQTLLPRAGDAIHPVL